MRALHFLPLFSLNPPAQRLVVKMSATTTTNAGTSAMSMPVKLPTHPTYNLKSVIHLALSEDVGDRGDATCKATIPVEMEVEAHFLAKEDGILAGIALADIVFDEVDPSLKVERYRKDGDNVRKGLQFDKVHAGGTANALKSVDLYIEQNNLRMGVEVETRTLDEVNQVLHYASTTKTSLTRIMLDNMVVPLSNGDVDIHISMLKEAVKLIVGRFETEASGNVTLETVNKIGQSGVTYISSGALTHSVKTLDISLKIETELAFEVGKRTKQA